jgi:hypothetical protein
MAFRRVSRGLPLALTRVMVAVIETAFAFVILAGVVLRPLVMVDRDA